MKNLLKQIKLIELFKENSNELFSVSLGLATGLGTVMLATTVVCGTELKRTFLGNMFIDYCCHVL